MQQTTFINKVNSLLSWITKLAYLNLLWIVFSLAGLVIVGFFPATISMMTICRSWLTGESELPVFRTFVKTYKAEFKSANLLGGALSGIGFLLYMNFLVVLQADPAGANIVLISAFYLMVFFFLMTVTHALPVLIQYHISFIKCMKNAFIIGLLNMHISLAIIISQSAFIYLMFSFPGSIIFFLGSILSIIHMWLALYSFKRIESKVSVPKQPDLV